MTTAPPKQPRGKRGGVTALSPRAYARSVSWRVDQDYLDQLGPDERRWLAGFLDRYYGADHRPDGSGHDWSTDDKRVSYRDKNAANRDLYSAVAARDGLVSDDALATFSAGAVDWTEPPLMTTTTVTAWPLEVSMVKQAKKPVAVDPVQVLEQLAPPPAREEEALPEVEWLSLARVKAGWVVLRCQTRGRTITAEETLSTVGTKEAASNTFRVEATRRFLLGGR